MSQHELHDFATTDRQRQILANIVQHGGVKKAAIALDLSVGTIGNVVKTLKNRAALKGVAPENDLNYPLAEGEILIGRSVHTKTPNGDRVWVKTKMEDQHSLAVMREEGMTPVFQVAVRNKDGLASLFRLSHAEIQTHEQVMVLVREEIPDAAVILVSVD